MDEWNEHTMELERESMDRQGEAIEIRLSSLGLAGAYLGEQEIDRLNAEVARLREALGRLLTFNISPMFDAKASYTEKKAKEWAALEWEARAVLSDTAEAIE